MAHVGRQGVRWQRETASMQLTYSLVTRIGGACSLLWVLGQDILSTTGSYISLTARPLSTVDNSWYQLSWRLHCRLRGRGR